MLDPAVAYRDVEYIGYPTGLRGQRELAESRDLSHAGLVFPPDDVMARLTPGLVTESQSTLVDILNEVKAVAGA